MIFTFKTFLFVVTYIFIPLLKYSMGVWEVTEEEKEANGRFVFLQIKESLI